MRKPIDRYEAIWIIESAIESIARDDGTKAPLTAACRQRSRGIGELVAYCDRHELNPTLMGAEPFSYDQHALCLSLIVEKLRALPEETP